jgi:hypothetical protein
MTLRCECCKARLNGTVTLFTIRIGVGSIIVCGFCRTAFNRGDMELSGL